MSDMFPAFFRQILAPALLCAIGMSSAQAQSEVRATSPGSTVQSAHIQRISDLGRLWARLRWVHPALVEGRIDWDRQLVEALPAISNADTPEAQRAVIERMMAGLNDSALQLGQHTEQAFVSPSMDQPRTAKLKDEVLLVSLNDGLHPFMPGFKAEVERVRGEAALAKALVMDLRPGKDANLGDGTDFLKGILGKLVISPLDLPAARYVYNRGWPSQSFSTSGGYYTAWLTQHSESLSPEPDAKQKPMVFIADRSTQLPMLVLALQKAGLAYIVSVGSAPSLFMPLETREFGSLKVTYRSGEIVFPDGTSGSESDRKIEADTTLGPDSPAVKAALGLLKSADKPGSKIKWRTVSSLPIRDLDRTYKEMVDPTLAWRQFAVIRLWSVIDAFFPYKDLMDKPWSEALPEFLAEMEQVKDGDGYALALARMSARLQDNHVSIRGHTALDNISGEAGLPLGLRMVEGSVLVDSVLDASASGGLKRWEEILDIDGESPSKFMARLSPYVASANAWTLNRNLVRVMGRGKDGTVAKIKVRSLDGSVRDVTLTRSKKYPITRPKTLHDGDVIQLLPQGIGYADLGRLMPSQVVDLFKKVKETKALILDMRGYPNGTAWPITPYLNVKKAIYGASYSPMTISSSNAVADFEVLTFLETLTKSQGESLYRGRVLMLINEMTQSQAEHSGLFFESASDITFVGSPSAGSNGDVTDLLLPGGISVRFTGQGIKHADGRQLQRVGLQPKLFVRPTVKGVREGKDEVMDRAIGYILDGH